MKYWFISMLFIAGCILIFCAGTKIEDNKSKPKPQPEPTLINNVLSVTLNNDGSCKIYYEDSLKRYTWRHAPNMYHEIYMDCPIDQPMWMEISEGRFKIHVHSKDDIKEVKK